MILLSIFAISMYCTNCTNSLPLDLCLPQWIRTEHDIQSRSNIPFVPNIAKKCICVTDFVTFSRLHYKVVCGIVRTRVDAKWSPVFEGYHLIHICGNKPNVLSVIRTWSVSVCILANLRQALNHAAASKDQAVVSQFFKGEFAICSQLPSVEGGEIWNLCMTSVRVDRIVNKELSKTVTWVRKIMTRKQGR